MGYVAEFLTTAASDEDEDPTVRIPRTDRIPHRQRTVVCNDSVQWDGVSMERRNGDRDHSRGSGAVCIRDADLCLCPERAHGKDDVRPSGLARFSGCT